MPEAPSDIDYTVDIGRHETMFRANTPKGKEFLGGVELAGDSCLARAIQSFCQTAGKDVPAGTMAMVSSTDFLRASERPTAIATLNRQRHLTPSCGGFTLTGERTLGPAKDDRWRA